MNKYPFIAGILLLLTLFVNNISIAQSLPVGTPVIEDMYRREQLLGKLDSNVSFTVRPLFPASGFSSDDIFDPDHSFSKSYPGNKSIVYQAADGKSFVRILPVTWNQQYNTHNPYGWNDGAMIPAAGYQTLFSAGVFVKYKFLTIQLQPEFVYAQNKNFDGFTQANNEAAVWSAWYYVHNSTDLPERFGASSYKKLFPGQSSIRLNFDPVSLGLSTENLWWGPGVRNSIIMSNTATGFPHLTLNTTRPVKSPIGSFEAQLISGKLVGSGYSALVPGQPNNHDALYKAKPNDWRYLSGLVVTYHPKWVPGLFLGLSRTYQVYRNDMGHTFKDYFPVFSAYAKDATYDPVLGNSTEDAAKRDQLSSIFARWFFTGAQAEVYVEYGKNDHNWDIRDLFLDPEHSRAYIIGMKKLFKVGSYADEYMQVGVEVTQLSQSANDLAIRNGGIWYTHSQIKSGYTNRGEVLGAGIGPGGGLQTLDVSWFKGMKRIGLQFERYEHDADLYYKAFAKGELRRHWVDFSAGLSGDWDYKQFLLSAKLTYIDQLNYEWQLKDDPKLFYWNYHHYDANNFQLGLSVTYRF